MTEVEEVCSWMRDHVAQNSIKLFKNGGELGCSIMLVFVGING